MESRQSNPARIQLPWTTSSRHRDDLQNSLFLSSSAEAPPLPIHEPHNGRGTTTLSPFRSQDLLARLETWAYNELRDVSSASIKTVLFDLQSACRPTSSDSDQTYDPRFLLTVQVLAIVKLGQELPQPFKQIHDIVSICEELWIFLLPPEASESFIPVFLSRFPCDIHELLDSSLREVQSCVRQVTLFFETYGKSHINFFNKFGKDTLPTAFHMANYLNAHSETVQRALFRRMYQIIVKPSNADQLHIAAMEEFQTSQANFFQKPILSTTAPCIPLSNDLDNQSLWVPLVKTVSRDYYLLPSEFSSQSSSNSLDRQQQPQRTAARNSPSVKVKMPSLLKIINTSTMPPSPLETPTVFKTYLFVLKSERFSEVLPSEKKTFPLHFQVSLKEYRNRKGSNPPDDEKLKFSPLRFSFSCLQKVSEDPNGTSARWQVSWPKHAYFSLNSTRLQPKTRFYQGKDQPLDITGLIKAGNNQLTIICNMDNSSEKVTWDISIDTLAVMSYEKLKAAITDPNRTMQNERVFPMPKEGTNNPESHDAKRRRDDAPKKVEFSVLDPTSNLIPTIPVRAKWCNHYRCFDLDTFLMNKPVDQPELRQLEAWKCPICGTNANPDKLFLDKWMDKVCKELAGRRHQAQVKVVSVDEADGSWEVVE